MKIQRNITKNNLKGEKKLEISKLEIYPEQKRILSAKFRKGNI